MDVQGQSGKSGSDSILSSSNRISLDVGAASTRSIQLKNQVTSTEEYALKVRKPYTISKQRERWTDEEHKKFLEALKLYGRAWRRIEEHVGSKTAVQIRSHAQKFFSKVVRESNDGDASSVKPIEIPPPRPKRKPAHPYPRKSAVPIKSGCPEPEKSTMSVSPYVSVSELGNQSPTSVLSALGTSNSTNLSGSPSLVSSNVGGNSVGFVLPEPPNFVLEESRSSPAQANASSKLCNQAFVASKPENQARVKVELFTQDDAFVKEGSAEASSTQCLKLFGKTVLVTESHKPSSPTSGMCKIQTDVKDETALPTVSWNFMPVKFTASDSECASSALTLETAAPFYYWPSQNESSRSKNGVCPAILPWGLSFSSVSFPCIQVHNPIPVKGRPLFDGKDQEDKENQKEGSSTGSNTESVSAETSVDKNSDIEAQGVQHSLEKAGKARYTKRMRGFVPYKRCLAERGISSSTLTGEEREDQRTRLCL